MYKLSPSSINLMLECPRCFWLSIVKKINESISSMAELEKALNVKAPTIYVHMKELRDDGFLNKENKLTEMGRIILLNN